MHSRELYGGAFEIWISYSLAKDVQQIDVLIFDSPRCAYAIVGGAWLGLFAVSQLCRI